MEIHQHPPEFSRSPPVVFIPLSRIHEVFSEPVPVLDIVPTPSPNPVPGHVFGSARLAAPTLTELPLSTRPTDGVDDPSGGHRVGEGRLSAGCKDKKNPGKYNLLKLRLVIVTLEIVSIL